MLKSFVNSSREYVNGLQLKVFNIHIGKFEKKLVSTLSKKTLKVNC